MDNVLKATIATGAAVVSYMVDGFGLAVTVLLAMMALDVITGLMVGYTDKSLQSSTGVKGLIKKAYILILIGAVYLLQQVVPAAEFAGDGLTITFIIMEVVSILENGGKLGAPVPNKLRDAIAVLKGDAQK